MSSPDNNATEVLEKIAKLIHEMTANAQNMSRDYECVKRWYDEKSQALRMQFYFPSCTGDVTALSNWTGLIFFESDLQRFTKEMKDYTDSSTCIQKQVRIYTSPSYQGHYGSLPALEAIFQTLDRLHEYTLFSANKTLIGLESFKDFMQCIPDKVHQNRLQRCKSFT